MSKKIDGGTVEIKGKADLKDIINQGNKAGKALDNTKKSAQSADRQLKGAARASSGASKNFSKMSQGITGGLVPAYATLAANLFALDAVFRFLKNSADFRVLKEGQMAFAAATGVAYQSLARDLQTATRGMINFRDAAQAGAIGRAAGLSAGQLRELSEAAFTVSVALGRDVTDSFNRLVRGVTKAEPELLDELGIILRLEEATTKYAASLNLNKNQLSIYQKSQAVVNEVLDQAEKKFGKINAIMEPNANAISQLGVAFEEAIDAMRPLIAFFAEGIAKFGKANIDVLVLAILGFAGGIINSVIPATHTLQAAQAEQTADYEARLERLRIKQEQVRQSKLQLANTPIAQQNFMAEMGDRKIGGQVGKDLSEGNALSGQQVGNLKSQLSRGVGAFSDMTASQKEVVKNTLDDMKKNGGKMSKSMKLNMQKAGISVKMFGETTKLAGIGIKGAFNRMTGAVLGFMATVGTVLAVVSVIYMLGKALYNLAMKKRIAEAKQFNEILDKQTESVKRLNAELIKMGQVVKKGLVTGAEYDVFLGNALESTDLNERLQVFGRLREEAHKNKEGFGELRAELLGTFRRLADINPEFDKFAKELERTGRLSDKSKKALNELQKEIMTVKAAQDALTQSQGEMIKEQNRLIQALPKVPYQNLIDLLKTQANAYLDLTTAGKDYEDHLLSTIMKLEMMNTLQEQALQIQKDQVLLDQKKSFSGFAGDGTGKRQLGIKQAELNLQKEIKKTNDLILNIKLADQEGDSTKLAALADQADLQSDMVAKAATLVELEKLRASRMFMTFNKLYQDIENDLGKAIGAGLRGDSSGFAKIGENMVKTMTDGIGQMLSEQFIEDIMPDALKPKSAGDEIITASQEHAAKVKLAIAEGSFLHYGSIKKGSEEGAKVMDKVLVNNAGNLQKILDQINIAEHGIAQTEKEQLFGKGGTFEKPTGGELQRTIDERDNAQQLSTTAGVMSFIKKSGLMGDVATSEARTFAEKGMGITDTTKLYNERASRGTLSDIGKLNPEDSYIPMQLADGSIRLVTGKEITAYKKATGYKGKYTASKVAGAGSTVADFAQGEGSSGSNYFGGTGVARLEALIQAEIDKSINRENRMFKGANKDYSNFLLGNTQGAKADVDNANQKILGIQAEGSVIDKRLAAFDGTTKPAFTETTITDTKTGLGLFNPDGTLNAEFISNFSGGLEGLTKLVNEAAGKDGEGNPLDPKEKSTDQFSKNLNQFSGVIGMMGALTGKEEATAKIMAKVAKVQLLIATYEQAKMAFEKGTGALSILKLFMGFGGATPARQGGIMSRHGRSYASGGIASGPNSGYMAELHGREAVVPLPNGRSIPVDIGKGKMATNNTNITVNVSEGGSSTQVDSDGAADLAAVINMAVQERIEKEMRPGGILGA